jgi:hypothetical protein
MKPGISPKRILAARIIAIVADAAQLWLSPSLVVPGVGMAVETAVDIVVGILMTLLVGWHWAFIPTVIAEGVPFVDLVPTWTLAVFLVTRKSKGLAGTAGPAAERPKRIE